MKIKKSILSALIGHATATGYRAHLKAWPTHVNGQWTRDFGEGYNVGARLADAGTTLKELADAGLSIQSDVHGRYSSTALYDINDRRHMYKVEHGQQVHATITPELSPSGLRPITIDNNRFRKEDVRNWHHKLLMAHANAPDDGEVEVPGLGGDITVTPGSPQAAAPRSFGAPKKPKGLLLFIENYNKAKELIGGCANALRHSERPATHADTIDSFLNLIECFPAIDKVTEADFDLSQIRPGCTVSIYDGAPVKKFVGFVLKSRGLDVNSQFIVEEYTDSGATLVLKPVGFDGEFLVNGKRFTVPTSAAYRRPPQNDALSVVVKANGLALYGDESEEVYVVSIDGDRAVILDSTMTETTVKLADLSPVGLG